jgi:hypothetical protein
MHTIQNPIQRRRTRSAWLPLVVILTAFIILSLIYAWATPPLEASDELWHVGMVNTIADTGQLPVQVVGAKTPWMQEGSQPPLYYLIAAALVKPIDRSDFDAVRQPNPHAVAGVPGNVGNKNLVLHDGPHPLLQGTALAVYLLRLFSILLGCVTVFAVYATAMELGTDRPMLALLAAGLTAFNPMFLFITASVNNDNLVTALNSLVIWQTLRMIGYGFSTRRSILIAVLVALASLSKISGLVLVPFVALAALWIFVSPYFRHRSLLSHSNKAEPFSLDWRGLLTLGALLVGAWLLLAGWWYLRNLNLYSELLGTRTMVLVAGARTEPFTLQTLLSEFQGFRWGYWGVFGAFNVMIFRWFYDVMDVLTILALLGMVYVFWGSLRTSRKSPENILAIAAQFLFVRLSLLGLLLIIASVSVVAWTAQTYASQGRLLFPFIVVISCFLALGLIALLKLSVSVLPQKRRRLFWRYIYANLRLPIAALGLLALIIPFASIAPQYAPPPPLDKLPDSAKGVYARFGDVALVGYETPDRRYAPDEQVPITLYWQVNARSTTDLSLYLHAVLEDASTIGRVDSYPGAGRLRTTTWQPGAIYADSYAVPLDPSASGVSRLRVQVGWWDYPSGKLVQPVDSDGKPLDSVMLDAGAFAAGKVVQSADDLTAASARFGGEIALTGYSLNDNQLTLAWDAMGTLPDDYTVFVQVLDTENRIVGQGDAPPPLPTRYWQPGEHFVTTHTINYPQALQAGTYRLVIGWYRPGDFARLSVDAPDNAFPLTSITIP